MQDGSGGRSYRQDGFRIVVGEIDVEDQSVLVAETCHVRTVR